MHRGSTEVLEALLLQKRNCGLNISSYMYVICNSIGVNVSMNDPVTDW